MWLSRVSLHEFGMLVSCKQAMSMISLTNCWMVCSLLADTFIPLTLILAIFIFMLYGIFAGTTITFSLLGVLASSVNFLT